VYPSRGAASFLHCRDRVRHFRPIDDELRDLERRRMIEALAATGGVQNRAAELIQMPLRTFVTKMKRYGITEDDWRDAT
jgi:DNA-binding NtrC family response regulator